ncbi:MAG: hypothetical protein P8Y05_06670 [Deinococcales bacterium]
MGANLRALDVLLRADGELRDRYDFASYSLEDVRARVAAGVPASGNRAGPATASTS